MTTVNDQKYLANHPLFYGLKNKSLQKLFRTAKKISFKTGGLIYEEGNSADHLFFILEGRVNLISQKHDVILSQAAERVVIQTLKKNDIMGWSVLVPPYRWQFDTQAASSAKVLKLDGKLLRAICEKDHHLGYELLKRTTAFLVERLNATRMHLILYSGRVFPQPEGA